MEESVLAMILSLQPGSETGGTRGPRGSNGPCRGAKPPVARASRKHLGRRILHSITVPHTIGLMNTAWNSQRHEGAARMSSLPLVAGRDRGACA